MHVRAFERYIPLIENFCKQTVEAVISRRLQHSLIWVCTDCLCPTKRTLGL